MTVNSPTFCVLPWASSYIDNTGDVRPCCHSKTKFGNIKTTPFAEIWSGQVYRQLRQDMIDGVWNSACMTCKVAEDQGINSKRHQANIDPVYEDASAETSEAEPLHHVSIDLTNLCNLKCRMCNPQYSTKWFADHRKLYGTTGADVNHLTLADLESLLPGLETTRVVEFEGGEPLLADTFKQILGLFVERGWTEKTIGFYSNMTVVDPEIVALLKQFEKVHVTVSIDAVGPIYSYMRGGSFTISDIAQNVDLMIRELGPILEIGTSVVYQVFNAFGMSDFIEWWHGHCESRGLTYRHPYNGLAPASTFFTRIKPLLRWPPMYSVSNLPDELKVMARADLNRATRMVSADLRGDLVDCLTHLDQPRDETAWTQFLAMTPRLDAIRSEDIRSVVPQFLPYFPQS